MGFALATGGVELWVRGRKKKSPPAARRLAAQRQSGPLPRRGAAPAAGRAMEHSTEQNFPHDISMAHEEQNGFEHCVQIPTAGVSGCWAQGASGGGSSRGRMMIEGSSDGPGGGARRSSPDADGRARVASRTVSSLGRPTTDGSETGGGAAESATGFHSSGNALRSTH